MKKNRGYYLVIVVYNQTTFSNPPSHPIPYNLPPPSRQPTPHNPSPNTQLANLDNQWGMAEDASLAAPLLQQDMSAVHPVGVSGLTNTPNSPLAEPAVEAVFVARFDVNEGNIIEWAYPLSTDQLAGIEFKVLVSGAHAVDEDFSLFQFHGLYGIAYYNQKRDKTAPRGAWQRSVGVLVRHHYELAQHLTVLRGHAKQANENPEANYAALKELYSRSNVGGEDGGGIGDRSSRRLPPVVPAGLGSADANEYLTRVALSCGEIGQLADYYGEGLFVLWRALLCRARVLFISGIPAGDMCQRVHTACSLLQLPASQHGGLELPTRLYYVTVADIPFLTEVATTFIACTTERIFADKHNLFDLCVDGREMVFSSSSGDIKRLGPRKADGTLLTKLKAAQDGAAALQFFEDANSALVCVFFFLSKCKPRNGLYDCMVGGVSTPWYSRSYQRYTVHERALYFNSTFFWGEPFPRVVSSSFQHITTVYKLFFLIYPIPQTQLTNARRWQNTPPKASELTLMSQASYELFFKRNGFDVNMPKSGCPCL